MKETKLKSKFDPKKLDVLKTKPDGLTHYWQSPVTRKKFYIASNNRDHHNNGGKLFFLTDKQITDWSYILKDCPVTHYVQLPKADSKLPPKIKKRPNGY